MFQSLAMKGLDKDIETFSLATEVLAGKSELS